MALHLLKTLVLIVVLATIATFTGRAFAGITRAIDLVAAHAAGIEAVKE